MRLQLRQPFVVRLRKKKVLHNDILMKFKFEEELKFQTMGAADPIFEENVEYILYFLILTGLLDSEDKLLFSSTSEKERVGTWLSKFKITQHVESCQGDTDVCIRCQALEDLILTRTTLDEMKTYFPDKTKEELILLVLEIYLTTQPQQRFASRDDFINYLNEGNYEEKYREIFDPLDSPLQRKDKWQHVDVAKKAQAKVMIEGLHNHAVTCFN